MTRGGVKLIVGGAARRHYWSRWGRATMTVIAGARWALTRGAGRGAHQPPPGEASGATPNGSRPEQLLCVAVGIPRIANRVGFRPRADNPERLLCGRPTTEYSAFLQEHR